MRTILVGSVIACACIWQSAAWGDDTIDRIENGKAATAFVELPDGKSSATAVCIHSKGLFVTNHHVVKNVARDATIKLILNPNDEKRATVEAKVLRSDEQTDLAVLQAKGEKKTYAFLTLAGDKQLFETMPVTSYGFPFGKVLAGKGDQYPDISVNVGRITALRKRDSKLDRIQLDAALNPGNSGGPVCNEAGQIVGIVQSGLLATGVNFAVPVSKLQELLVKPVLTFQPPPIPADKQHEEIELSVVVEPFQRPLDQVVVELALKSAGQESRKVVANSQGNNEYRMKLVPIPAPRKAEPASIPATVTFGNGSVQGSILDREFKLEGNSLKLTEIRSIEFGAVATVIRHDGGKLAGKLSDLTSLLVDVGGLSLPLEVSAAKKLELRPVAVASPSVEYVLTVRLGEDELARQTGTLPIQGSMGVPTSLPSARFTQYQGESQKIDFPDTISDAVWGGGGRLLLLHLKKSRKVAVYDVNQAKIVTYLSVGSEKILISAGLEKAIIVAPDDNLIERWSLATFQKETTRSLPVNGVGKSITLGYASAGPLLIHWAASSDALATAKFSFFNLENFEEIKFEGARFHNNSFRDVVHIRASGLGDVFGFWATSHSPQGLETLVLSGNTAKSSYQHDSAGHVVPNYDGSTILTAIKGAFTPELNNKGNRERAIPLAPSTHSRFYVSIPAEPGAATNLGIDPFHGVKPAVFTSNGESRLVDLPDYELGKDSGNASWQTHDFTLDKRVMFVPQANQLLTIPFSNDRLLVKPFNIRAALDKANIDYLYVTSIPPRRYRPGQHFEYPIEIASRDGSPNFELSSGPEAMSVSPSGVVAWQVPGDFRESKVNVIVTAKSTGGQSVYESFTLVRESP